MNFQPFGSDQPKHLFCLSPACPSPTNRMCTPPQVPQYHVISCNKWMVDLNAYGLLVNPKFKEAHPFREEIQFYKTPVQGLIRFFQCRQDIGNKVNSYYQNLKKEVLDFIDYCRVGKLREIQFMTKEMEEFKSMVLDALQPAYSLRIDQNSQQILKPSKQIIKNISIKMNTILHSHKYKKPSLKDMIFYDNSKFKEQIFHIKNRMVELSNTVCSESEVDGAFQRIRYTDMEGVEEMLSFDKENKLQEISQLLNWGQSQYFLQKNHRITEIKCPICIFRFEIGFHFSIGKSKLDYTNILIQHLLQSHFLYLSLCHSHRISRSSIHQLPISELIHLMKHYQYDQIDIYDATNLKALKYEPNSKCLTVLFTTDTVRREDFQYCYCIVNSPEQAAFGIILLMKEVCINLKKAMRILNFKRQYYNLYNTIIGVNNINCRFQEKLNLTQVQKQVKYDGKSKMKRELV